MKNGIRKRLSFVFSYGGQYQDLVDVLNLIAQGVISPRVKTGRLEEFPRVLRELCQGEVEDRVALLP
jgi:propanol-preferring alcohol dehydrogenase